MATPFSAALRQLGPAVRALIVLTVLLGLAYPLAITAFAQVAIPGNADGSLVTRHDHVIASDLIGQAFTRPVLNANGKPRVANGVPVVEPDPSYFQSRPSAAGNGYDPLATSASNLGPNSSDLLALIRERRQAAAKLDGVPASQVPPDALMASGSGLDPDISPAYAAEQVARVARERGFSVEQVRQLVAEHTQGRTLGFIGEPRVNVVLLNLALDDLDSAVHRAD